MIACGLQEPFTIINNYFFLKTLELYSILIPGLVLAKRPLICIKQSVLMLHASIGCEWQIWTAVWVKSTSTWVVVRWQVARERRPTWPTGLRWATTAWPPRPWIAGGPVAPSTTSASASEKGKYSNGNRKPVNHKPKVSYVMLVRQWVVLYLWRGKSFLPFRGRIATVIPLTCTLNRQMPFNCQ